jgi:hypothetical protein
MIVALIVTGTTVGILGNRFMPLREPWIEAIRRGRAVKTRRLTLPRPRRLAALSFSHPQAITTSMFSQRIRIRRWDASLNRFKHPATGNLRRYLHWLRLTA